MFSTFEKVENTVGNVENYRKSAVFAWKSVGICVEKKRYVEKETWKKRQSIAPQAFWRFSDRCGKGMNAHEKNVEKKFFHMEIYVENMTKARKIVIFRPFGAKKRAFRNPYLVLTYWAEHHIML